MKNISISMKLLSFKLLMLLFVMSFHQQTFAQAANDSLLTQMSRKWTNAKTYAIQMVELMPEEFYNFKPSTEEMSFGEQVLHLANNIGMLSSSYLSLPNSLNTKNVNPLNKAEVVKILSAAYDIGLSAHRNVKPEQLDEIVKFFAGPLTKRQIFLIVHDHQSHHIGQLIVYLRLKGIKPVNYIGW